MLEGTRSILFQSGLPHCYWAGTAECFAPPQNIRSKVRDTKGDAYSRRFGTKSKGLKTPFGSLVRYLPKSCRELNGRGKFDPRTRLGIFVGYKVQPGGIWTGVHKVMDAMAFRGRTADAVAASLDTKKVNINFSPIYNQGLAPVK